MNLSKRKIKKQHLLKEPQQGCVGIEISSSQEKNTHPLFSFKYLKEVSYVNCKDYKFLSGVITRFHKLSELGWEEIQKSDKHGFGMELLPRREFSCDFPNIVTPDVKKIGVIRDSGDNKVMIGLRDGQVFHVFYICANFKDIYSHGKKK